MKLSGLPAPIRRALFRTASPLLTLRSIYRIFRKQGWVRSRTAGAPLDETGAELPWFTYPAIEYIRQLDFSGKSIFEFGAGHSTMFWSRIAAHVTSVENNPDWHSRIATRVGKNVDLHLVESPADYPRLLPALDRTFDVIVVDGIERYACCEVAVRHLNAGGVIILDNSDWHQNCSGMLRSHGLLEVDMTGFGPVNDYTWTTSFYFSREFAFAPRDKHQPAHGVGSVPLFENKA